MEKQVAKLEISEKFGGKIGKIEKFNGIMGGKIGKLKTSLQLWPLNLIQT